MTSVAWAIAAAFPAVLLEYLYRVLPGSYGKNFVWFLPLQLGVSYGIYQLVRQPGTTLIDAFVVWAFCTASLRVLVAVVVLQDEVARGTWAALGLVLAARLVQVAWR